MNTVDKILPDLKLRFNIEHPDLDDCYLEGFDSALASKDERDNPYKLGTLEHEYWSEGWWAGFYEGDALFKTNTVEKETELAEAANENLYHYAHDFISKFLKLSSALAVTALVGYQIIDLVA